MTVRGVLAGLLALAGSTSVGFGLKQEFGFHWQSIGFDQLDGFAQSDPAMPRAGLSRWDRARLGACVAWAGAAKRELRSELDRRAHCAQRLGLDASRTQ